MSQFDIQGGRAIFQTDILGDMKDLVCIKSFSVNKVADTKEITTDGSGIWKDYDYDRAGYTVTINGLVQIFGDDDKPTMLDLDYALDNFLEVGFRILFIDDSDNPAILSGQCIVPNTVFDASPQKLLNGSVTLLGKGELVTHKPTETNTITFSLNGVAYVSDQQLTAVDNCYKISDSVVMSTSNETSIQQLVVTFRLPKGVGGSFGADYNSPVTVGLLNVVMSPITDTGTHWAITLSFDYAVATLNKSFSITEI